MARTNELFCVQAGVAQTTQSAPRVRARARWDDQGGPQAAPQPAAQQVQQPQQAQHMQQSQQAQHAQQAQQQYGQQQYDQYGQLVGYGAQGMAYPQQGGYPGGAVPQAYPMQAHMVSPYSPTNVPDVDVQTHHVALFLTHNKCWSVLVSVLRGVGGKCKILLWVSCTEHDENKIFFLVRPCTEGV